MIMIAVCGVLHAGQCDENVGGGLHTPGCIVAPTLVSLDSDT